MVADPLDRSILSYIHGQFIVLDEDVNVAMAVRDMHSRRAEIIIVTKDNRPVGVVTDSDILDKVVMKGEDSDQILLKSIMSSPVISLSAKGNVRQALELMRLNTIKHIPVTDNIKIFGIVTQEELANAIRTSVLERTFRSYRAVIRDHYKPVIGNLGFVMQFAGILLFAPAFLATILNETVSATGIFLGLTFMFAAGFALNAYGEKAPLNLRQASMLIVSSFILLSLFGSIPYMYVNPFWNEIDPLSLFVNSFFESASGFTTTGLSMITQPENLPQSFVLYRSYTQWVGGLSFVYLVMMLFYPERKLIHMRGMIGGGTLRSKQLIITISVIFSIYTALLSMLLYFLGDINNIQDVALILSTVTGGGFVPTSTYVVVENAQQLLVLMAGMIISALPFALHFAIFSKEEHTTKLRPEVFVYIGIILISILIFTILLSAPISSSLEWLVSAFHIVSVSTTSGFQFINISSISFQAKILLIILMLVGGTAFSTAGGIKVGRLLQIVHTLTNRKTSMDTANRSISSVSSRYNKLYISYEERAEKLRANKAFRESLLVISLFVLLSFITGAVLSYFAEKNFIDSLFESVSALTTTGITTGITTLNLDLVSKTFLIINMISGRFEIIAIFYIFFGILEKYGKGRGIAFDITSVSKITKLKSKMQ
ncbi:MAG TPA: potassium transporter TrkG, partial [Nitrososphaeraceae archaeon]|nr:potassium transporter TrkG [Nitrososphaeraceae archaeon]